MRKNLTLLALILIFATSCSKSKFYTFKNEAGEPVRIINTEEVLFCALYSSTIVIEFKDKTLTCQYPDRKTAEEEFNKLNDFLK